MKYSIILIAIIIVFFSCNKKDSSPATPAEKPLAIASYDNSNYGIYKGVFIGSTGNVVINVNNDNTLNAVLKIDGTTATYTSTQTIVQNQASTINFVSGSNSFTFSVAATGGNPVISNINIAGHPAAGMSVLKEKSDSLVKCYEGTFTGGSTGTFNMEIKNNLMNGLYNEVGATNPPPKMNGTITNNQLTASAPTDPQPGQCSYAGTTISGTISANGQTISGTYSNCYGSGTWTGTRTK
ncbi:MAG: hypothetical protein IPP02_04440 [Chitinophagaceae bacterium]|jgi:hypothetical protein|nr:hypothetical protein [Chitinophagaceae bacterium]MBK7679927.1 hypothetical protein [Chitinophagaceae bacterium]MBK9660562.1 hypothetical protein [Chitinophagaceae bacterium]MBK9937632.1 hypothetical protein [Chitinophagaceae bacterium]